MEELLKYEKDFLSLHHSIKRYNTLSKEMLNYNKNDILWAIYNELLLSYQSQKDWFNCFLTYKQMSTLLYNEKKYEQALQYFILALYVRVYEIYKECVETGFDTNMIYERHITKFHKDLKKYMNKANIKISTTDEMCDFIKKIINHYQPKLKDDFMVYWLSFKYIGSSF